MSIRKKYAYIHSTILFRFCPGVIPFEYNKVVIKKPNLFGSLKKIHAFKKKPVFKKYYFGFSIFAFAFSK